jgi:hypothetical protein
MFDFVESSGLPLETKKMRIDGQPQALAKPVVQTRSDMSADSGIGSRSSDSATGHVQQELVRQAVERRWPVALWYHLNTYLDKQQTERKVFICRSVEDFKTRVVRKADKGASSDKSKVIKRGHTLYRLQGNIIAEIISVAISFDGIINGN